MPPSESIKLSLSQPRPEIDRDEDGVRRVRSGKGSAGEKPCAVCAAKAAHSSELVTLILKKGQSMLFVILVVDGKKRTMVSSDLYYGFQLAYDRFSRPIDPSISCVCVWLCRVAFGNERTSLNASPSNQNQPLRHACVIVATPTLMNKTLRRVVAAEPTRPHPNPRRTDKNEDTDPKTPFVTLVITVQSKQYSSSDSIARVQYTTKNESSARTQNEYKSSRDL